MMKKVVLAIACALVALGFISTPVFADACSYCKGDNCEIICKKHKEEDAENMVGKILQTVFMIVGIVAVIVIIIGGIMYSISQGDSGKITTAKNTILYAAIGLLVSVLSFAIVTFVLTSMGGEVKSEPEEDPEKQEPTSVIIRSIS